MRAVIDPVDETFSQTLARSLAATARGGDVLCLEGDVGAGKTHFARAFIQARQGNAPEDVPSPTFTIVQTYDSRPPFSGEMWHADLYRLSDRAEMDELGLEEAFETAICLVEWPDRGGVEGLRLTITAPTPDTRRFVFDGAGWPDLERAIARARFLHEQGWGAGWQEPLAGDASARRYFRIHRGHQGQTAILMEDAGDYGPYLYMTGWLRARGFYAPEILAQGAGFLLLEDLGDDLVARVLDREPLRRDAAYRAMTDLLIDLHRHAPPEGVIRLDGAELARQLAPLADYLAVLDQGGVDLNAVQGAVRAAYDRICDLPLVCGLRDFHAENLILKDGRLAVLDFQDAVAVHPAYDLMSGLQDVRREVPEAVETAEIAHYIAQTGVAEGPFRAAYALLGVARNLRILGIFTRLARAGKPRYLAFMPRTWALIDRNLSHPELADLRAALAPLSSLSERGMAALVRGSDDPS